MRDIRDDLMERIQVLELQMSGVQGVFEQQVEQLKEQRDSRLEELKIELDTVNRVMQIEQRRYSPTKQAHQTVVIADMRGLRRAG
jgi:protein subunit release factor B